LQHLPLIRREEDVQPFRPSLHRHGHATFGAALRQIEVGVHDAAQVFQLRFRQVVLGHHHIAFEDFSAGGFGPGRQPHAFLRMIRPPHDQFGGGVAVHGAMHLVLHFGEELLRDRRVPVVIHRRGIDVGDLLIKVPLGQADLPDFLQQPLEVILAEERAVLHALPVHHIAPERVIPQDARGPLPESRGALGIHPVAHRDDRIQVVVLDSVVFAVGGSC